MFYLSWFYIRQSSHSWSLDINEADRQVTVISYGDTLKEYHFTVMIGDKYVSILSIRRSILDDVIKDLFRGVNTVQQSV